MEEERVSDEEIIPSVAGSISDDSIAEEGETKMAAEPQKEDASPSVEEEQAETSKKNESPTSADILSSTNENLKIIAATEQKLYAEVREMHKLYHTEYVGRLRTMQNELDKYHEIDRGRAFDDILGAIARIYVNNETLTEEVSEPKAKKSIRYLLMDLEELMEEYGMEKIRSTPGETRRAKHSQILNRIPTEDPAKHNTVVKSYNSGFCIGNRTVIKEMIDVYLYEAKKPSEAEETQHEAISVEQQIDEPVVAETAVENKEDKHNG